MAESGVIGPSEKSLEELSVYDRDSEEDLADRCKSGVEVEVDSWYRDSLGAIRNAGLGRLGEDTRRRWRMERSGILEAAGGRKEGLADDLIKIILGWTLREEIAGVWAWRITNAMMT